MINSYNMRSKYMTWIVFSMSFVLLIVINKKHSERMDKNIFKMFWC